MSKNTAKKFKPNILVLFLVISLALNVIVVKRYSDMAQKQNTLWSNSISQFTQVVNWLSLNSKSLAKEISGLQLDGTQTNLRLAYQQLENLQILPYSNEIFTWQTQEKFRLFLNYQTKVIELLRNDLKETGQISVENKERMQVIHQAWEEILKVMEQGRNARDPFSLIFRPSSWKKVWDDALKTFDQVELIPLPEE